MLRSMHLEAGRYSMDGLVEKRMTGSDDLSRSTSPAVAVTSKNRKRASGNG